MEAKSRWQQVCALGCRWPTPSVPNLAASCVAPLHASAAHRSVDQLLCFVAAQLAGRRLLLRRIAASLHRRIGSGGGGSGRRRQRRPSSGAGGSANDSSSPPQTAESRQMGGLPLEARA